MSRATIRPCVSIRPGAIGAPRWHMSCVTQAQIGGIMSQRQPRLPRGAEPHPGQIANELKLRAWLRSLETGLSLHQAGGTP